MSEIYAVLDCETTGLFNYTLPADADGQPRMCSMALVTLDESLCPASAFEFLIKPDGWTVSDEVAKIHGLTTEKLTAEGVPVADALAQYLAALDASYVIVGYNVSFDLKVLRGELRRAKMEDRFETTRSIDVMRPLTDVCKIPKANGRGFKLPKLIEAAKSIFGEEMTGAHGALADAMMCARIFKEKFATGIFKPVAEQRIEPI